jgi:hypothetical protein
VQVAIAFGGALTGFPAPPPRPFQWAGAGSGGGGGGSSSGGGGGSGSGGGSAPEIARPDPERGPAEAIDLGEPISIIATVVEEPEGDDAGAPARGRCCGCLAPAAGGPPPPADRLVGLLLAATGLLALAAAARAAALYVDALLLEDRLLLTLQALPELLSAALLLAPPHAMARAGMAARYARWQPRKGKPATSRPKNSNPAIWKRAGLPAPESRTQTQSEGA